MRHGILPQLAVFECTARLGSFTRAAEEMHLAQPTVSIQIKKLSEMLGLPLFEQIGKKMHLTPAGEALQEGCRDLFAAFGRIDDSLARLRGLEGGRLRLAVSTTGKYFAPRLLAGFVGLHPKVEVSLQIHNRQALIDRLARNEDDLYIFANPPTDQEVVCQPIMSNPMVLFARADHPLARSKAIPFAALAHEPFLMREPGSGTRSVAWEAFDRNGIAPRIRMELSTNEAIKQAILAGLGVSILSRYTLGLDTEQDQLAVLDVEGLPIERPWQFVYPVGKQIPPAARAFMDFVRAEGKRLVEDHLGREASRLGMR
ncbi:MAG: LysR family transcriptional regulator [Betaproteobacteria bacterium]|nr:LysR family transcriptional regulator [Betaproteobacteria bacterium]